MIRELVYRQLTLEKPYVVMCGLSSDTKPTNCVTGSKFTEVDTGDEYMFDEESGMWLSQTAGRTSLTGATVTLGSALSYTGSELTQAVSSVVLGTTTLTANTDYLVVNNKATLPGDYTLHIVGIGSYSGVIAKAFTVGKGAGSVSASPDSLSLTEGGDAGTSTLSVTGDGAVSVESSAGDVATAALDSTTVTVEPVAEGSATVTVTLAASDLYTGDTATIGVTVAAAADPEDPDAGEG